MPNPPTDQQLDLDAIETRANAATAGPWGAYTFGGDTLIEIAADLEDTGTGYRARREICRLEDEPLDNDPAHREWTAEEDWAQVQADAAYIAAMAPEVAMALLDEVRRLRAELDAEKGTHAFTLRQRNNRSKRLLHLRDLANAGDTEALYAAARDTLAASVHDHEHVGERPFTAEELAAAQADVDALDAEFPGEPQPGSRQCGHDDYHDPHEWADRPGVWCPGHSLTEDAPEACAKCKTPFDPADTRFDGHAQHKLTPYCRRCVDLCHDNESADHRCVICARPSV